MGRRSTARARLLSTAAELFRDRGYAAVGVADLCARAEVNKGSFYHFFRSKQTLVEEVLDSAWDETGMLRRWESAPPARPLAELRRFIEELFAVHYADLEATGRVRGSLVSNLAFELGNAGDDGPARRLRELLTREAAAFERLLGHAVTRGEISLSHPGHTARTLVASLHGLLLTARLGNDLSVLPRAERDVLRLVGARRDGS